MVSILDMFEDSVRRYPDAVALHYFGRSMSRSELNEVSERIAHLMAETGVNSGDRVIVSIQNTPVMCATLLACWKLGAIAIPVNPMVRVLELSHLVRDSGARLLIAEPGQEAIVVEVAESAQHPLPILWSHPREFSGSDPIPFVADPESHPVAGEYLVERLATLQGVLRSQAVSVRQRQPLALICYTSGTTGVPKGAMITHANLGYQAMAMANWYGLREHEAVITLAPLFHITGMGQNLALCLANGLPLVLTYRFEPSIIMQLIEEHHPVFAIGAITAYLALSAVPGASPDTLGSIRVIFSGGAAVPAAVVDVFEDRFGAYIHNAYGLTEAASACILVPLGERAPVDEKSGALSIGRAIPDTTVKIVDDDGATVLPGVIGELVVNGPGVCAGYWNNPDETLQTFQNDGLHTGDVAIMDEDGWVFIVDRKKDLIIVSGYKVWPREVEDVLYRHPAVLEAAVVGIPDGYRGETAIAFVVTVEGVSLTADDLRAHCRDLLSAYKCPTEFNLVEVLPKTATGKVLRRELAAERHDSK